MTQYTLVYFFYFTGFIDFIYENKQQFRFIKYNSLVSSEKMFLLFIILYHHGQSLPIKIVIIIRIVFLLLIILLKFYHFYCSKILSRMKPWLSNILGIIKIIALDCIQLWFSKYSNPRCI